MKTSTNPSSLIEGAYHPIEILVTKQTDSFGNP